MLYIGLCTILLLGGLCLTGAAWAQSSDDEDEQETSQKVSPSSTGEAALAEAPDEVEEQGREYHAPGVHVWVGRRPSTTELRSAITQARAQAKSRTPSASNAPEFQNEHVQIWKGRLPPPEALRNRPRSSR